MPRRLAEQATQPVELGDIAQRLARQRQLVPGGAAPARAIPVYRPLHAALAGVVGSQRQRPVTIEQSIQILEVVKRGARGHDEIASAVIPVIDLDIEITRCTAQELPRTGSPPTRVGKRIERALDHRQQRQFTRQIAAFDLLDDVMHPRSGAIEHPLHVIPVVGIPVSPALRGAALRA